MLLIITLIIFSVTCTASIFLIDPAITFPRIFTILLIILVFSRLTLSKKKIKLKDSTKSLLKWVYIIIIYKFIIDFTYHFTGLGNIQAIKELLKEVVVVSILPIFEIIKKNDNKILNLIFYASIPPIIFGIFQIFNSGFVVHKILPKLPLIEYTKISGEYLLAIQRIVGMDNISIPFAFILGTMFSISFFLYQKSQNKNKLILIFYMFIFFILIVYTGTRSAIYGIIPSIIIANAVINRIKLKKIILFISIFVFLVYGSGLLESIITPYSERAQYRMDSNTWYKLSAEIYGIYGSMDENPLIGVSERSGLSTLNKGANSLGNLSFVPAVYWNNLMMTNHNIFGYYIRFYGLMGFGLFIILNIKILKKIFSKKDIHMQKILLVAYIFFLQFNMLHTGRLLLTWIIWILLSLGEEKNNVYKKLASQQ